MLHFKSTGRALLKPISYVFLSFQDDKKKIKTESGVWIPASYKSDRYAKWKQRSKLAQMQELEAADGEAQENQSMRGNVCSF